MELTNQDSDSAIFFLKVQDLREDVALLRRQLNQERNLAIENQRLMRSGNLQRSTRSSSTQTLEQRVSTDQSNHNNQCNSANLLPTCNLQPVVPETRDRNVTNMPSLGQAMPSLGQAMPSLGQAMPSLGQAMPSLGQAMPSLGQAMPNRARVDLCNNGRIDSRPMAKLKAPGPFETQALSENKRLGYHRPTPSSMYRAVTRMRRQRVKYFREQLDNIDNRCMQELRQIELSKCRLTPLLQESSAWHSSVFANSSDRCIPATQQDVSESQCTDRPSPRPRDGGRSASSTFEPQVNSYQSNDFVNGSSTAGPRWYKTDAYNTSRARLLSDFGDRETQHYDKHVLTRNSHVNTISYSLNSDNYRFKASKEPYQKYDSAIPDFRSPYVCEEEFSDGTLVADSNETNGLGYPLNSEQHEFNVQDYENNMSPRFGQSVNIGNSRPSSRPTRPIYGSVYGLNSIKKINQDYTKTKYHCLDRKFEATNSYPNSTGYQSNSLCRPRLSATKRYNQEQYTHTDNQCSDGLVNNFANNSTLTSIGSRPSLPHQFNSSKKFNDEEWSQTEDQCTDRKYLVNNVSCNSRGYQPKTSSCRLSQTTFNQEYSPRLCNNSGARSCAQDSSVKSLQTEDRCSDRKFLVNDLSYNSPGYQPKTSPCSFNQTTYNQEYLRSAPPSILCNNSEASSCDKQLPMKFVGPVFNPLFNQSEYQHRMPHNFKQEEHNSCLGRSMAYSPAQFEPDWSIPSQNETPIELENGLSLLEHGDDWWESKSWTVDEVIKLDEEVTKSMWELYNNQVRDLAADILKPYLSESTVAYLKQFPPE